jgi:phage tail sheath protein FI
MAIQLSPGVSISEVDLTTVVPSVSTSTAAYAGNFVWGPANIAVPVNSENNLVTIFGSPNSNTYLDFFTCSSFLAYATDLRVVRTANSNSFNAMSNTTTGAANASIPNNDVFAQQYLNAGNGNAFGAFTGRYIGVLGNSIQVDVYDGNTAVSYAQSANNYANATFTSGGITRTWSSVVSGAPNTSIYVANHGGANDEFHVVVSDATGLITGTKGTILETFPYLSKATDATDGNNVSTYYKQVIFNKSQYIYSVDAVDYANTNATWGRVSSTNFARGTSNTAFGGYGNTSFLLVNGSDQALTDGDIINGYNLFSNPDVIDVSLVLTGARSVAVTQAINTNVTTPAGATTGRGGDAIMFISPPYASVVNQPNYQVVTNIQTWLGQLNMSTSYAVVDSGWKYMYDKYNNTYRYVPLNGDIAGLCAFTDEVRDPWYSPAGYNRGNIKNVIKLAWNPALADRNILYPLGVNPVVTFPGNGTILYGDKTLQAKPSAFDRINVRRLFIVLEKAIARAAKYSLFEFNDSFTQAQFISLVSPFLRQVKGRRGITDFRVVCDSTNNTPQVVDSNQFVGDIYIKPARSINFIQLNFVAVGTGVNFSEVTGAV